MIDTRLTTFEARYTDGQFVWLQPRAVSARIKELEGKRLSVTIGEWPLRPTVDQYRFFHGVICKQISEAMGNEIYEVKNMLKGLFLWETETGEPPSLKDCTRQEISDLIDGSIRWAANPENLGLVIEDPYIRRVA